MDFECSLSLSLSLFMKEFNISSATLHTCFVVEVHFCGRSQVRIWPSYIGRVTQIVVNQNNETRNGDRRYNPTTANRTGNQDQWENNSYEGQRTEMSYEDKELFYTQTAFCVFREWKRGSCDMLRWKPSSLFILLEVKLDLLSLVPSSKFSHQDTAFINPFAGSRAFKFHPYSGKSFKKHK